MIYRIFVKKKDDLQAKKVKEDIQNLLKIRLLSKKRRTRFCFASSLFSSLFCFFSARMRASSIFFCSRASFLLSCFSVSFLAGLTFFFSLLTGDAPFSFLVCLTGAEGLSLFLTVFFTGFSLFAGSVVFSSTCFLLR